MYTKKNKRHQLISLLLVIFAGTLGQAYAIPIASPSDNGSLRPKLDGLTGSSLATMAVGLVPFWPVSVPAEIAAFGTEMGVINTPAVFSPPADKKVFPNAEASAAGGYCQYDLEVEANKDADAGRFYFLNTDALWGDPAVQSVFGNLGEPYVYHPHGSVRVSADNPTLLPVGKHKINWQAETRVNTVLDIALPSVLLASTIYSEKKTQQKVVSSQINKLYKSGAAAGAATRSQIKAAERIARAKILRENAEGSLWGLARSFGLANVSLDKVTITTAKNRASQNITVWDEHPPYFQDAATFARVEEQQISLEATDFGGVRLGRVLGQLQDKFAVTEDCNRPTTLTALDGSATLLRTGVTTPVTWQTRDGGPYHWSQLLEENQALVGEDVITTLVQHVTVEDTQPPLLVPPAGFARESDTAIDLTTEDFPLGRPKIVDLADPRPTFSRTAPDRLELDRRYAIVWQAQDASGNVTVAPEENPDRYTQYVTIKTPGTNTAPMAEYHSAATTTTQAVEIELTGVDNDIIDGRADPLAFRIEDYPANGQFEAPLLPFFIEDFRLSPVGDHETIQDNEIVRTSPLKHLADDFRLAAPQDRGNFLGSNICWTEDPANIAAFQRVIPVDFVYNPTYVHVDDDDNYYVRDSFWSCDNEAPRPIARISKWDADGTLLAMRDISALSTGSTVLDDDFSVDSLGWIWFSTEQRSGDNITASRLYGMNKNLDFFDMYGEVTSNDLLLKPEDKFQDMAVNTGNKVFYELRGFGFRVKSLNDQYNTNRQLELAGYLSGAELDTYNNAVTTGGARPPVIVHVAYNIPMTEREGFTSLPGQCIKTAVKIDLGFLGRNEYTLKEACPLATDIEVDSDGYVYIAQKDLHRILKYAPAYQDENGIWQTGEFIGWMGDCSANRQNSEGVFYNACNEELGISQGFQCTDEKCQQANTETNTEYDDILFTAFSGGVQPGAFKSPASMKMGPRDILYVADTGNSRVQRFGADGAFVGEARSTGTGINQGNNGGFMLGNFGKPYSLSVNSSAFYVINRDDVNGDNFLHVFKTLPFYDVTDHSAKIKYVSDFNYQGTDTFSYSVDDGIDQSATATVSVNVTRAFRPPQQLQAQCYADYTDIATLTDEIPCRLDEDDNIVVRLLSKDPDGFISTGDGGLDQHTYSITMEPQHGRLTLLTTTDNAVVYRYTPDADYNGDDRFSFNAFDGVHRAENDGFASFIIDPVPDPVDISLPGNIKAARGFNRMITAEFSDVDENYQPELLYIKWGDGTATVPQGWANSGRSDENGAEITPQIDFTPESAYVSEVGGRPGTGRGMLVGGHLYQNAGNHTLEVRMMNHDNAGAPFLQTLKTANIEVIEATVVTSLMDAPVDPVNPDTPFDIQLTITNEEPDNWAGLIARDTGVKIELPDGMTVLRLDSQCRGSAVIECGLGDLAVGERKQIRLSAKIDLAAALVNTQFTLDITLTDEGPHIQETNLSIASINVADEDGDAVVDVVDAFPGDDRYSEDTDKDGMADAWELRYGLNENDAADAAQDPDGDGASNLVEFIDETYPLLAEATAPPAQFSIAEGGDDRLGFRVAAGDINNDGYSDVVAGAPGYQGQGAIVVYYGSADGAQALAPVTVAGTTEFGRAVAVGDLNNDQYADIAVSSVQGVYLFMGGESLSDTPMLIEQQIFVPEQPVSNKFGVSLLIADLDNDGLSDLIVGDTESRAGVEYGTITGAVHVYRAASAYWQDPSPVRDKILSIGFPVTGGTRIDQYRLGDSLTVGDIDGDSIPDLMAGAAFPDPVANAPAYSPGVVSGFLGRHIDWSHIYRGTQDFILYGEASGDRFGYSIASGKDLDGDGNDDLVVGAYANSGMGAAYLYRSTDQFWDASLPPAPVKIQGAAGGDQFGVSVALTPAIAYSGKPTIIIGSNRAERNVEFDEGRVDLYSEAVTPESWLTLYGEANDMLGYAVASAGDVNNDGETDYVIGAPNISSNGYVSEGGYIRIYSTRSGLAQTDSDGDFVADPLDNCIDVANTEQSDEDNDGKGDACDANPARIGTGNGSSGGGGGIPHPLTLMLLASLALLRRRSALPH